MTRTVVGGLARLQQSHANLLDVYSVCRFAILQWYDHATVEIIRRRKNVQLHIGITLACLVPGTTLIIDVYTLREQQVT